MKILTFTGGFLESNSYILYDRPGGDCVIVDPGYHSRRFLGWLSDNKMNLTGMLLTHHHYDHTGVVKRIRVQYPCPVYIHERDEDRYHGPVDVYLKDGDVIDVCGEKLITVHTPGHTHGSCSFLSEDGTFAFTGDSVFQDEVGRFDLDDGDEEETLATIRNVFEKWPAERLLYPGHGAPMTMGQLRKVNRQYQKMAGRKSDMDIKLIALDLDGTALNEEKKISARTRKALEDAAEQGVNIVIATGRPYTALPADVFEIEAIRYVLTSNGAAITDLKTRKIIYENCLSPLAAEKAVDLLRQYDYIIETFTHGNAYLQADYWREIKRTGKSFRSVEYLLKTREPMEDVYQYILDHRTEIENISVNFEDNTRKPEMMKLLQSIPETTITSSFANNLEIGGATTSKADALSQLENILGVKKEEMMVCGDSLNDLAMMKIAGLSVAMGNGGDDIKAAADYVTLSNGEDGVAAAVEKFVLNRA